MNKYESSLKQVCLQCKTKPANCNKKKCVRYNNLREAILKAECLDDILYNYLEIVFDDKDRPYFKKRKEQNSPIDIYKIIEIYVKKEEK